MKTLKLMLSACVAAVALVSCNNEDLDSRIENGRMKSVEVSLANAQYAVTRGLAGEKITAKQAVVVNDLKIFLTDAGGNVYHAKVADGSTDAQTYWTSADLANGALAAEFHYVDHGCTKVVAVANLGKDMDYSEFLRQMDNLEIGNEQDAKDLSLYAEATLTKTGDQHSDENADGTTYVADLYKAELTLKPRISRFEVDGFSVKFNDTPTHGVIKITDLLFQHYAAQTSLATGTETDVHVKHINDLDIQSEVYNWFNNTNKSKGWYWDAFETPLEIKAADAKSENQMTVAVDTPDNLAYHFFSGSIIPTFVIKMIVDDYPAYIYSKGFYSATEKTNGQPTEITQFEEGKIYRMSAKGVDEGDGSIPIDEDDIDPMDRCIEISVDVVDWVVDLVYPEF